MEYGGRGNIDASDLEGRERTASHEGAALLRRLKAASPHFGCYPFRAAFVDRCVDSGTLEALLGQRYVDPSTGSHVILGSGIAGIRARYISNIGGTVCRGGSYHGKLAILDESCLDAAPILAVDHHCNSMALVFGAHSLKDPHSERVSAEEAELLARTSYGLSFVSNSLCKDIAESYGSTWPEDASMSHGCLLGHQHKPRGHPEEGLAVENLWVIRERGSPILGGEAGPYYSHERAWSLHLAYGVMPEVAAEGDRRDDSLEEVRRRYKSKVIACLKACALAGCDGLLVGCAEGVLACEVYKGVSCEMAADVWGEVLLGDDETPGLARHFKAIAFCLGGRTNPKIADYTWATLRTAFTR